MGAVQKIIDYCRRRIEVEEALRKRAQAKLLTREAALCSGRISAYRDVREYAGLLASQPPAEAPP